ncbi:MAG TPA: SGNH/GDSL hydrolase family protein, partial [Massilia sp.]|nr:SGNH/GDSL hydrolase family protein [Massilia sp.]
PAGPPPSASTQSFTSQTLRLVVHTSIGGSRARVRFSNEMGSTPLRIGAASIGVRSSSSAILQSTLRTLSFGGQSAITIPAGAPALSDPVELAVPAQADLAISLYLPGTVQATTIHDMALTSSYLSPAGDYTSAVSMPVSRSITSWPFLTEVDVDGAASTLVAIGDSLTDGARSTGNVNRRWPDYLVRRLQASLGAGGRIGVVNRGISANLLLNDYATALIAGRDVLERFDRDVLATAGVRYLAVLIGINDISYSSSSNPIPAADLIAGYRQVIARAHAHGITVIGATLPPMAGFVYYTAAREAVRLAANSWIRFSGEFDAVADIEAALRDPHDPAHILPLYDSGDHLHPNDAGYQAMANAFPLSPFVSATTPPLDFLNRY